MSENSLHTNGTTDSLSELRARLKDKYETRNLAIDCGELDLDYYERDTAAKHLDSIIGTRFEELERFKSYLVAERHKLRDYLTARDGSTNLVFEQKKLELLDKGEVHLEEALTGELRSLAIRFPGRGFEIPEHWDIKKNPELIGEIVEKAVLEAIALEDTTLQTKGVLKDKMRRNELLRREVQRLEEELAREMTSTDASMDLETEPQH